MDIIRWIIGFAIVGAVIAAIASDSGKEGEGAAGGAIGGIIVFAGILIKFVLPILLIVTLVKACI